MALRCGRFVYKNINNKITTRNRTNLVGYGYIESVESQGLRRNYYQVFQD
jgi:hypothetical protein